MISTRRLSPEADVIFGPGSHAAHAARDFSAGELIERSPVIAVLSGWESQCHMRVSGGHRVLIPWIDEDGSLTKATALGAVGRYGLSSSPNVELVTDAGSRSVSSYGVRDIAAGEHLHRAQLISDYPLQTEIQADLEITELPEANPVLIRDGQWGKGGFAAEDIAAGTVVEECPLVLLDDEEIEEANMADWNRYYFVFGGYQHSAGGKPRLGGRFQRIAMSLGYGGVYNHSSTPSLLTKRDYRRNTLQFVAARDIEAGEEMLQDYMWADDDPRFGV